MNRLKLIARTFIYVLAGSIISTATFITIFLPDIEFDVSLLWQVIIMSLISAIGSMIFESKKEIGKKQMKLRKTVHFIYTISIVFGIAVICRWVDVSRILQLIVMLLMISGVYFSVCFVMFKRSEKEAECMNQRLRKIYPEEEKEE